MAHRLAKANIITNKNLVPEDKPEDWDHPSGLRIGTIEVTRLGMNENDMETIADFIARVLVEGEDPESVGKDVIDFRLPRQTLYYNFDNEYPAWATDKVTFRQQFDLLSKSNCRHIIFLIHPSQPDPPALGFNLQDFHLNHISNLKNSAHGDLRPVQQAILLDADVDERAEIHHIADRAFELHACHQVFGFEHIRAQDGRWACPCVDPFPGGPAVREYL